MIYLLDTNTCIQYLTGRSENVINKFKTTPRQNICLCDVVKAELYYGACRSNKKEKNLALYELFFSQYVSLPFDGNSAKIYGAIRAELSKLGTPIGAYDFQIAAIALSNNLILVTHNTREFQRVENLQVEDWEENI
ncbi:type II toxin-antitoxin system VapC family toxin [Sphaerospermopsis sp. LEGE 00249]|uniref:type II toxin-antitoxin system tRNA(fMet)-specific endonuclease VapC n=1 Tax=Sphaerospermopsis sp. LEGE 00249 TaxID=1380707 RepID=UPI00164D6CB4|nr:type II toxin-antitoxin system VapC family toxin [Sphaerospermopsis sp. LEGE 00249]MBC5798175.1 type II toxin-antitoxin system VapC family toxin [Sphaerospermopsis sp. LEGE 00249]